MPRRTFLSLVGGAAASNACIAEAVPPQNVGDITAGNESTISVGTLTPIPGQPACIGRDKDGIYAMTLICPHQGCNIGTQGSVSANGIDCYCHGSRFSVDGSVVQGPANSALAHFAVSVDSSGNLTVHTGSQVEASVRLVVE